MRVLHVLRTLDPAWGGPVEGVRNLTSQALRHGIHAEIACLDEPDSPWLANWIVPIHATGGGIAKFGYSSKITRWLKANIRRFDALVVHGIWMYFSFAVWKAATANTVPYYLFIHGALDPWFKKQYPRKHLKKVLYWRMVQHKILRDADAVVFTTEEEKTLAHDAFRPYCCNPVVVGYGIRPPPPLIGNSNRDGMISSFTLAYPRLRNRRFLLYLGRIHEKKGIDLLLRAFADLKGIYADCALVVAGPGDSQTLEGLQALGSTLNLQDRTVWTGPLYAQSKWLAIRASDAFVLPSHQENFGISVVEALACGTPVLISNKVNIWREVDREQAGFIDSDDLEGTTRMLRRWASLGDLAKERASQNAQRCFYSHFDITSNCDRFFQMLRSSTEDMLASPVASSN